jgi:hypothetical protein
MRGKQPPVQKNIEQLRAQLEKTALMHGDLLHPEVLRVSQELDLHIVKIFREQLRLSKIVNKPTASPGFGMGGK